MNVSFAKATTTAKTHVLQSRPDTVHWGFFDAALEPVLTVDSGDRVVVECVSGNPDWMPAKSTGFEVLPELKDIHLRAKQGTGNHILTGPIFVRGAAIGDVLEVRILDIELRQNWGYNLFRPYGGTLAEDFPHYRLIHVALDKKSNMAILPSGLKVPMRPFFGQLAVAPRKSFGRQNSKEPREFGGNLDCRELIAGSTIYLPIWNEGALFSTGDGHAAQGDGEVNGTAIGGAVAITGLVTLLFALAPALATSRVELHDALRSGSRQSGAGRRFRLGTEALVVGQIALALTLLIVSGLMIRTALIAGPSVLVRAMRAR